MSPKKKKFKGTWIAAGIFVLLAVVALYLDSGDKANRDKIRIYKVEKEDIKSFELTNITGNELVACERYGASDWGIIKPKVYEGEKSEIETVVTNLASLYLDRKIDKPEELKNYGLEKPSYSASFTLKNGKKHTLLIGDKNPTDTFFYVKDKDGKDIYMGYSFSLSALIKNVKDLRKKSLFDINTETAYRADLKFETKEYSFLKGEDKNWLITPYNFKGNKIEVERLISELKALKAKDIIEDDPKDLKKYGLDRPRLIVTVADAGGKNITVLVGKKSIEKNEDYAKLESSQVIYSIPDNFLKETDKNYNDYREKKIVELKEADVSEVEILDGKKRFAAVKGKNGSYAFTEPAKPAGDKKKDTKEDKSAEALKKLVTALLELSSEEFTDDSGKKFEKYGLKTPATSIALYGRENNERALKLKFFLGEENKKGVFLKIHNMDSVFTVNSSILDKIKDVEKAGEAK